MDEAALARSYDFCRGMTRRARSSFYAAFSFLPDPRQRRSMEAIYAYMRFSDDLADGDFPDDRREELLDHWQANFLRALKHQPVTPPENTDDPLLRRLDETSENILPAVIDTLERYRIPPQYFVEVLLGMRMDIAWELRGTPFDREHYTYYVASVVGLICLHVWGVAPELIAPKAKTPVRKAAVACGMAFQWTNFLRDMKEDAAAGRRYLIRLPESAEDERFARMLMQLAGMGRIRRWRNARVLPFFYSLHLNFSITDGHYRAAGEILKHLPPNARKILVMMLAVYRSLYEKIKRNPARILRGRVRLSRLRKLWIYTRVRLGLPVRIKTAFPAVEKEVVYRV